MSDDKQTAWDDAHSLGIALRLAQAQNRELRKQLAASTSEVSLKFQDGICHDCESPDLCIQDNGCHNTGKVFSRNDRPTCEKADSTSETPRTDAEYIGAVSIKYARQLERELAQAIKDRDELLADVHQPELCDETILGLKQQLAETQSQQWQPIEKPEDVSDIHRPVVLWYPSHDAILYGAWDHCIEEWREWITDCPIVDNKPTHWMPLPEPPMSDK